MKFTLEERKILSRNPYTQRVSESTINYTKEFKREFIARYNAGAGPTQIFVALGYDTKILGRKRIEGTAATIKRQYLESEEFKDFSEAHRRSRHNRPELPKVNEQAPNARTIQKMKTELLYLRQEVEFIKKILRTETGEK